MLRIVSVVLLACSLSALGADTAPAGAKAAKIEDLKANWPVFRGWGASGRVHGAYEAKWNGEKGENVLWKVATGMPGNSSPVVWGDKVFITGGIEDNKREVACYSVGDGKLLWRQEVTSGASEMPTIADDTGWAPATPAVDGERVYAIYPTGDLVAFDFSGKLVWQKYMGKEDDLYGHASSLTIAGGNVIVQWDVGVEEKELVAKIFAFDGATGKEVWKKDRPNLNAWASPAVTEDGKTVVAAGSPWVIAYETATGEEKWRAKLLENDVACSPTIVDGICWIANDHAVLTGIKMEGKGDVTKDVLWKQDEGLPALVSPISDGKLVWTVASGGFVYCFDGKTGDKIYPTTKEGDGELKADVHASPVIVGENIWITDIKGVTHVIGMGREFKELGKAELGEGVSGSLAFSQGKIFIRGSKHLFCIGKK